MTEKTKTKRSNGVRKVRRYEPNYRNITTDDLNATLASLVLKSL